MAGADQVQHQIGGGGGTAGGKAVLADDETVGQHLDVGMGGGEVFKVFPMHRGAVAIKKPRARQHPAPASMPPMAAKRGAMRRRSRISGRVATSA